MRAVGDRFTINAKHGIQKGNCPQAFFHIGGCVHCAWSSRAFVLDGLRDALVGASQRTLVQAGRNLQFNELKSSYRKPPGPPSVGGSEEIVVRIAECVFGRTPRQGFRMHNFVGLNHPGRFLVCELFLSRNGRAGLTFACLPLYPKAQARFLRHGPPPSRQICPL